MSRRFLAALLGAATLCSLAPSAHAESIAEIRLVATRPGKMVRQPIALPPPRVLGKLPDAVLEKAAAEVRDVLWDDLRYSGVFEMVAKEFYARVPATTQDKVPYDEWNAVGAAFLVLLDISSEKGELVVEGRLFETRQDRKMILAKRFAAPKLDMGRRVAHKFADQVIAQVGGEPGVCSTEIAFVSDRDGGRDREIYMMDYDGFGARRLTGNRKLNMSPEWSPNNEQIVYTSYILGNPDLWVLERSGGPNRKLFAKPGMNSSPAWSPEGSLIAFASSFEGGDSEIYTIRPDGSGIKRLTDNRGIDTNPAWSPTGREMVFTSDRGGRPDLWIMDADGLNVRRLLTQVAFNDGAAWAPKGKGSRLAFAGMSGGVFQIFVYTVDTGQMIQLTQDGSNEGPSWSPDGRQIAFASTRGGKTDIFVMNDDGENTRRVTSGGNNLSPDWSNR